MLNFELQKATYKTFKILFWHHKAWMVVKKCEVQSKIEYACIASKLYFTEQKTILLHELTPKYLKWAILYFEN